MEPLALSTAAIDRPDRLGGERERGNGDLGSRHFGLEIADGFWTRFRGLMLRPPPDGEVGLLLARCASIHTAFMRYALDLAYLDRRGQVVACVHGVKPWRTSMGPRGALHTLEFKAGDLERLGIEPGLRIEHAFFDGRNKR